MTDNIAAPLHNPKSLIKTLLIALAIAIPLVLYGIGVIVFPALIRTTYQGKNCDSALTFNKVYASLYPQLLKDKGLAGPVQECTAYKAAVSYAENAKWQEAYDAYQAYVSAYPSGLFATEAHQQSSAALFQLAKVQTEEKNYENALANLNLVVASYSDTGVINDVWDFYPSVYMPWGVSLRETKDFAGSERVLNDFNTWSVSNQKNDSATVAQHELTETYLAWGLDLRSQKQYEDAVAKLDLAAKADSQSQSASAEKVQAGQNGVYIEWGNTLLEKEQFPTAIEKFDRAVSTSKGKNEQANDALSNGQIQWAHKLTVEEDFDGALEHLESAKKVSTSTAMKASLETALQETYLAFSKSSGTQARRAMKEALKTVCEKHKAPQVPIFGLNKDSVRFGIYGAEEQLPADVAAKTPGEMHEVVCVTTDNRTIESRQHKVILFQFSRGYLYTFVDQYRVQIIWNVKLLDMATAKSLGEETLNGEEPPSFSETGGNYFYGKPPMEELTTWLQSFMQ